VAEKQENGGRKATLVVILLKWSEVNFFRRQGRR